MNRIVPITLLALACFTATRASADSPAAQAEVLFRQGRELAAAGKLAEACAAFDSSQKLAPAITTQLNQASCRERNHQFATAWGLFVEVGRLTRNATDEEMLTYRRVADERSAKLEPILSMITINVAPAARVDGLAISRGDTAVSIGEWGRPLPVDGGTYTISATAPGHEPWRVTVSIGHELDVKSVTIPLLKKQIVRKPPPPPPKRSPLPIVLGASALGLGGTALGIELWGASDYAKSEREPDNSRQRELYESAKTKRYVAQGIGVASVAAAGLAVWWYVRDRRARERAVEVAPMVGHEVAGLTLGGSW
jgi:hypothetical protein